MEATYKQTFTVSDIHVDRWGRAKPSVLVYFAQEVAGGHCKLLGLDWNTLSARQMFWAVIRQRVQVTRLPMLGETVTVETWPMPTTRVAYPRATVGYDADGKELFRVIGLWVLMNTQTRAMILPGKSGVTLNGILRGDELSAPGSILPQPLANTASRKVVYTELDRNGHMNNTRYLDWLADLLPGEFHKDHPVKDFMICYNAEALEGQSMTLRWQLLDGVTMQVDACREPSDPNEKQERVFSAQMHF